MNRKKLSNFSHDKCWRTASNYVAKCYIDTEIPKENYFNDVKVQMDAKLWAEIYNRFNPPKKIDMIQMCIIEFKERAGSPLFHLEHYIQGNYVKYNSNSGYVDDSHQRWAFAI
jgi:elongation factor 2 kinase